MTTKKVWLPDGRWTDIFTGDEYIGGGWTEMTRWLDSIPVLAKEGAVMPLDGRRHTNSISNPEQLEVLLFNGNGSYTLIEDKDDARLDTLFVMRAGKETQTLTISCKGDALVVEKRDYKLYFKNIRFGKLTVLKNGQPAAYCMEDVGDCLTVTLKNTTPQDVYQVGITYTDDRTAYRNERILYSLMRLEGDNDQKRQLFRTLPNLSDEGAAELIKQDKMLTYRQKRDLSKHGKRC